MDLWLLVATLVVLLPAVGYWRYTRLARWPGRVPGAVKLRAYAIAALTQWALVAWCALVLARRGHGLADLGLAGPVPLAAALAAVLAALGLVGGTLVTIRGLGRDASAALPPSLARILRILPLDRRERLAFAGLAVTAAFCEEVLYRGFLIRALEPVLPATWLAVLLAGVAFGFGHLYQGGQGVATTGVLGIFLGFLYVWSGSLWPGIAMHFAVDLLNGFALGEVALLVREREEARAATSREEMDWETEGGAVAHDQAAGPFDGPGGTPA